MRSRESDASAPMCLGPSGLFPEGAQSRCPRFLHSSLPLALHQAPPTCSQEQPFRSSAFFFFFYQFLSTDSVLLLGGGNLERKFVAGKLGFFFVVVCLSGFAFSTGLSYILMGMGTLGKEPTGMEGFVPRNCIGR